MDTLNFILDTYEVREQKSPIHLLHSRVYTLPRIFRRLGFKIGAEIGVFKGRYSECLLKYNKGSKLYLVDPWKAYGEYDRFCSQALMDINYGMTVKRLESYNCEFIKEPSIEAAKRFEDESLDFVYIDALHDYDNVKLDIEAWDRKVKKGGIVAGHDYIEIWKGLHFGVVQAVNEWVKKQSIEYLFILEKGSPNKELDNPSFFYIKK